MRFSSLIYGSALLLTAACLNAKNLVWNNAGGGNWGNKNNWQPKQVPVAGDIAIITNSGNFVVTLDVGGSASGFILGAGDGTTQTFSFSGQTLTLDGTATINGGGSMDLSSGAFKGDTNGGGALFTGILACSGGALAGKFTVTTNSVLNLAATNSFTGLLLLTNYGTVNWSNADLYCTSSLQINNYGLWGVQSNGVFHGNGAVFNNPGTVRESGSGSSAAFDSNTVFNSYGTVDVEGGMLAIQSGSGGGAYLIRNGASLNLGGNAAYTLTTGAILSGSGTVGGSLLADGAITVSGIALAGNWTVTGNGVVNLAVTGDRNIFSGTFTNYGTVDWNDQNLYYSGNREIHNYGLWVAFGNDTFAPVVSGNTMAFHNGGTFRKSGGTGTVYPNESSFLFGTTFYNTGLVDVQTGALEIDGGTGSGAYNIATNTVIAFAGHIFSGDPVFGGGGNITGYLAGTNAVLHGTENFARGSLLGTLTLATNNVLNILPGASWPEPNFETTAFTNYGTVNWYNLDLHGAAAVQLNNYGLWDAKTNNTFYGSSGAATVFNNYGTFRKSGGTGTTTLDTNITFNSSGLVDVPGGGLQFYSGVSGGGTFNVNSNAFLTFNLSPFPIGNTNVYVLTGSTFFSGGGIVQGGFGGGNAVINGTLTFNHVSLVGSMAFGSNAIVTLASSGSQMKLYHLSLTNYGTVIWSNLAVAATSADTQLYNYGLWDARTDSTFEGYYNANITNRTLFNNCGIFRKSGGFGTTTQDDNTIFNNSGLVDVQSGELQLYHGVSAGGSFNVNGGAFLTFDLIPFPFGNTNYYALTGNSVFSGAGLAQGVLIGSNAVINGSVTFNHATLGGSLTIASNALVTLASAGPQMKFARLSLTNYGEVDWNDVPVEVSAAGTQVYNYGLWDARANSAFEGYFNANITNRTPFNNYGIFRKSRGTGITLLDSNSVFNNPGTIDVQVGQVNFGGDQNLAGGRLNFGLNGPADYGMLFLSGSNGLAGNLSVNLNNGFSPVAGNSFALVTGATNGGFSGMDLPALASGLIWRTKFGSPGFTPYVFTLSVSNLPPFALTAGSVAQGGGVFSFSFAAIIGQAYQVQSTTNLAPPNWVDLGSPITATNTSMTVSGLTVTNGQGFYRIRLWP